MKILFITDLCPISDDEFGLPFTLLNFILDFKKSGNEVVLLRSNVIPNVYLRKRKLLKEGEYEYKGIKVINKNFLTPFFKPSQFEFLKNKKYDIILSHMPSGVLAAAEISKLLNIPYCAAVHSSDIKVLTDIKYAFLWHNIKSAYKGAAAVLPRSYWLSDKIQKIIPDIKNKISLIPSGIERDVIISEEKLSLKEKQFLCQPIKIFSAGSLIKRKNFDLLIKAVKDIDNITLEIAGSGSEWGKLHQLINKYHLDNKVKLLGQLPKDDIYKKMEEASIFILVSSDETFGMVYLEALAKGCITICTENSGMAGFIKDGINGFLTPPDKSSLKQVILKIIHLKNLGQIIQNARAQALLMNRAAMSENYFNSFKNIFFKI